MKTAFRRFAILGVALVACVVAFAAFAPDALADNDQISAWPLGTHTTSAAGVEKTNWTHRGVKLHIDVDAVVGGGSVDVKVQTKDPVSGTWVDLTSASTGADTAGTTELTIYPGIAETANVSISDVLPKTWRVYATIVTSATFSVGASYID